ncbi:MAG: YgaP-like transmembrane domain, partial [Acidobacteriota bacterium]
MKNEGTADRVIRVVIGIALLCLLFLLRVHGPN